MSNRAVTLACWISLSLPCLGQSGVFVQNPTDAQLGEIPSGSQSDAPTSQTARDAPVSKARRS